jgi:hypothetical protein
LRSCISTLMTPMKLPPVITDRISERAMYSSYSWRWRRDRLQVSTCSCLGGICFSTSDLRRLGFQQMRKGGGHI